MRYAGAVQIDHAMQMMRLFWIPKGENAGAGAYVRYPFQDLLGIVTLESRRNKCMVIARDRISNNDYFEQILREKNIFPCSFSFADANGGFRSPVSYPEKTIVMALPADRPALANYWEGRDLEKQRREFDLLSEKRFEQCHGTERAEIQRALVALEEEELLPPGVTVEIDKTPEITDALIRAIHRYLARTEALLLMVRLDDIFRLQPGESDLCSSEGRRNVLCQDFL